MTAVKHVWVDIEEADLSELHVLVCAEWYLDTAGSFRLIDTPANLKSGRGVRWPSGIEPVDHLAKVNTFAPELIDYDAETTDDFLILIAADQSVPYTIIDGTNRASALYRNYLIKPNTPWRAILVAGPAITNCIWHIDSAQARANIVDFKAGAARGALW